VLTGHDGTIWLAIMTPEPPTPRKSLSKVAVAIAAAVALLTASVLVSAQAEPKPAPQPDLTAALAKRQGPNGEWVNPTDLFMEGDANLVTAYGILALASTRKKAA